MLGGQCWNQPPQVQSWGMLLSKPCWVPTTNQTKELSQSISMILFPWLLKGCPVDGEGQPFCAFLGSCKGRQGGLCVWGGVPNCSGKQCKWDIRMTPSWFQVSLTPKAQLRAGGLIKAGFHGFCYYLGNRAYIWFLPEPRPSHGLGYVRCTNFYLASPVCRALL